MYMFLSDRIRRMFLSGACPQNLSPKNPLSLKDQSFLQKTKAHQNLSRVVSKQQKLLYERHIGRVLQETLLKKAHPNSDLKKVSFQEKDKERVSNIPIYLQICCKVQKTIKTKKKSTVSKVQNSLGSRESLLSIDAKTRTIVKSKKILKEEKNRQEQALKLSTNSFSRNRKAFSNTTWKPFDNSNYPSGSLVLFVQSFFIKKKNALLSSKKQTFLEKKRELLEKEKISGRKLSITSFERLATPSTLANYNFLNELAKQNQINALLANRKSKYTNCRYLYDHESLKTCIVPQIFKNQKPVSRAKTLLHERKTIALLYGQLAKKDILNISRKALSLPGFFEDNMFTLLESRVDVCIFRAGFSKTIAGARQLIRNGLVLINGKKIWSSKRRAEPGDYFTITSDKTFLGPYHYTTLELYKLCLSSRFLREWFFLNKIKFFRKKEKRKQHLRQTQTKNGLVKKFPESVQFNFLTLSSNESYKPAFYCSLYWGFFLYKLSKVIGFSCFFEKKRKKKEIFNTFKGNWNFSGMLLAQEIYTNVEGISNLWDKEKYLIPRVFFLTKKLNNRQKQNYTGTSCFTCKASLGTMHSNPFAFGSSFGSSFGSALQGKPSIALQVKQGPLAKGMAFFALPRKGQIQRSKELVNLQCKCHLLQSIKRSFTFQQKKQGYNASSACKKKKTVLLNLYTQFLLKKLRNLKTKRKSSNPPFFLFRKNIPSSNLWAIWGEKPLHLEISHKTGSFIYLYKPQKIISPVCLNFKTN